MNRQSTPPGSRSQVGFSGRRNTVLAAVVVFVLASCTAASVASSPEGTVAREESGGTPHDRATTRLLKPAPTSEPPAGQRRSEAPVPESSVEEQPPPKLRPSPSPESEPPLEEKPTEPVPEATREIRPTSRPAPQGFACESPEIDGLSFLEAGWHDGTEIAWGNIGCIGTYQVAAPHMAVVCSEDVLNGGWMAYAITEPTTLEPNFAPDADPDIQYPVWMANLLWFTDANNQPIAYQLPWTYTRVFARQNLATGTFRWAHNDQWFNADDQLVYDQFNARYVDTRVITNGPARALAVSYLLYWPASDHNGAGAAFTTVPLHGVGYCDI